MTTNYLKRYYKLDFISCIFFSLFLLYFLFFADNTKSMELWTIKASKMFIVVNVVQTLFYTFLLPFFTFGGNLTLLCMLFTRKLKYKKHLINNLNSKIAQEKEGKLNLIAQILKHKLNEKRSLLLKITGYLIFLSLVLTTNNSPTYLVNYCGYCLVFTCIYFGTIVHFIYLPNLNNSTENQETKTNLNYTHHRLLYKLFLVQLLLALTGVIFGNYLLLLDWYQIFARFPVTNYLGISLGHFLSSFVVNLLLMVSEEGKIRSFMSRFVKRDESGESKFEKSLNKLQFVDFILS